MPESGKLTKEQQDYCYEFNRFFQEIADDMTNCERLMKQGKFFDAIEFIQTCNVQSNIGKGKVLEFVKELKESNLW